MGKEKFAISFRKGLPLTKGKYPGCNPRTVVEAGIRCEYDIAVKMSDGAKIYVDVFRPDKEGQYPVLIAWSPYGKHGRIKYKYFPGCGVCDGDLSKFAIFEAPDPVYWCANDYIVIHPDPRGSWGSEGDLTLLSEQEAMDGYDLIEWAGTQSWSNARVGMHGVSYLAWSQWKVAALNPPHLAAINPWEGVSDFYRELVFHGGIPETEFLTMWMPSVSFSTKRVEDLLTMAREHPLFDAYWAGKNADLSKITIPVFAVASWSDHGLHARGTMEGFKKISSKNKWLWVHGLKKWQHFYLHVSKQKQFFDRYLKGIDSDVKYWPRVKLEIREQFFVGNSRYEDEWPLARTQYTPLFLNAANGKLCKSPFEKEARLSYSVDDINDKIQNAFFEFEFEQKTELTGYMKLKLWVQAQGSDDMDLFVAIQKIDRCNEIVTFPYFSCHDNGPVALGWLRVSHRELDQGKSTAYQPYHTHKREIKLKAAEIVPVEIEIWPSSTLFKCGEKLRVVVQGSDIYTYPDEMNSIGHRSTVNQGKHFIYTGGRYDSHLLVPVIPAN